MAFKDIFAVIHLYMNADKQTVRPIIVYDHIMNAQHAVIFSDAVHDLIDQLRVRRLSQQVIQGAADQRNTGVQDKTGHDDAHIAIQIEMQDRREQRRCEYGRRSQRIG